MSIDRITCLTKLNKTYVKTNPNTKMSHFWQHLNHRCWLKRWQKTLHPFCSVHLEQVSNKRNDHKSRVNGVRSTKESVEYFFYSKCGGTKWTCTAVRLIVGVHLIQVGLYFGFSMGQKSSMQMRFRNISVESSFGSMGVNTVRANKSK